MAELYKDTTAWVHTLSRKGSRRVAYAILEWIDNVTDMKNAPPNARSRETSPKEFMRYLNNGVQLAKLAEHLHGGKPALLDAKEESEKLYNIQHFLNFARNVAGLADKQLFDPMNLIKGVGYEEVLGTLITLAMHVYGNEASENGKYMQCGLSPSYITGLVSAADGNDLVKMTSKELNCLLCWRCNPYD